MISVRPAPTALPAPRPVRLRITPWTVSSASEAARAISAARRLRVAATRYSTMASGRKGPRVISPRSTRTQAQTARITARASTGSRRRMATGMDRQTASSGGSQSRACQPVTGSRARAAPWYSVLKMIKAQTAATT